MSLTTKRSRRELDDDAPHTPNRTTEQRLYLIFDDWPWGYSIYELDLLPVSTTTGGEPQRRRLPPAFIRVDLPGNSPPSTHLRKDRGPNSVPPCFQPILDVRSRAINFGPGQVIPFLPIFFPIGDDELYSLDTCGFKKVSLKPIWPPRLEPKYERWFDVWSWECLPEPPFDRVHVTSYAAMDGRDGGKNTFFLVSTATATFAFDTVACIWKQYGDWSLPFTGRAHFVRRLDAFVGISKDSNNLGRLCSCKMVDGRPVCKLSKEKLFSEDPVEDHVRATLVYMGEQEAEFCLVQCISIEDAKAGQEENGGYMAGGSGDTSGESTADLEPLKKKKKALRWGEEMPPGTSYFYYLTTFSLGYVENNGGSLTTGESCQVQCYKVPESITQSSFLMDPVAFWM